LFVGYAVGKGMHLNSMCSYLGLLLADARLVGGVQIWVGFLWVGLHSDNMPYAGERWEGLLAA
jgi:hypothetical protein